MRCVAIIFLSLLSLQQSFAQPNFVNDPADAEMLVVTHEDLRTANWQPGMNGAWETKLLSIKSDQGIDVYLYEVEDEMDQFDIKDWIDNNCEDLDYLMIVGDAHRDPDMYPYLPDTDFNPASPVWADVDFADGNVVPLWGEIIDVDIYSLGQVPVWHDDGYVANFSGCRVGRIPAETLQEINNYMDKCVEYYEFDDPEWAYSTLLMVNDLDYGPGYADPLVFPSVEKAYLSALNEAIDNSTLRYSDCPGFEQEDREDRQELTEWYFNNGLGVVTACGTGALTNNFITMIYDGIGFEGFTNEGEYPFIIAACCDLGAFDYWAWPADNAEKVCILEELLLLDDAGIIGAIAPVWWTAPQHCWEWTTAGNELIFQDSEFEFGTLHATGLQTVENRWDHTWGADLVKEFILFGDPSLSLPYDPFVAGKNPKLLKEKLSLELKLENTYPNPFNSTSRVTFSLPSASEVRLSLSDMQGRTVSELLNGQMLPGMHQVQINGSNLPAGVYILNLRAGDALKRQKAVVVK